MRLLLGALGVRERAMVFLDMALGLRRGELAGLKWEDVHFEKLYLNVTRSVVDQQIGNTKTEVSRKPVPIDDYLAKDLLAGVSKHHIGIRPTGCLPLTACGLAQTGANSLSG